MALLRDLCLFMPLITFFFQTSKTGGGTHSDLNYIIGENIEILLYMAKSRVLLNRKEKTIGLLVENEF